MLTSELIIPRVAIISRSFSVRSSNIRWVSRRAIDEQDLTWFPKRIKGKSAINGLIVS